MLTARKDGRMGRLSRVCVVGLTPRVQILPAPPPGMLGTCVLGASLLRYKRVPHGFIASPMGGGQRQQAMPSMPACLPV